MRGWPADNRVAVMRPTWRFCAGFGRANNARGVIRRCAAGRRITALRLCALRGAARGTVGRITPRALSADARLGRRITALRLCALRGGSARGTVGRITPGALSADARLGRRITALRLCALCRGVARGTVGRCPPMRRWGGARASDHLAVAQPFQRGRVQAEERLEDLVGVLAEGRRRVAVFHRRLGQADRAGHLRHRAGQRVR
ncbi:Uncharacterised protein [Pseudomonas aeruginosa]|nr:Uncharacterised protein [Pseudomonas aeruginosa]